ncbi:LysM peptidoglycan-binding domain-containing protein [Nocardia sp. NBC_01503]|uniref:LysM peptidoglycan-binding domain-containing protein n=1 Tax=Nocardia sp. NBC_01503 TaxID=2975997 RepID=UPI002E7B8F63|nr:LysM peptidoglycan-binding domain-containing protein [Nocardia sp. NBC_01503]WTL35471.1 LysM peptidoglycan-binding domain-containing protein [Nocardia sp. NBC_01503]
MGDALKVGEELGLGQSLVGGAYSLTLQDDGNLVLADPSGKVEWASATNGKGVKRAALQADGNFVLYSDSGAEWSTETNGKSVDRLVVQPDRNVVLYGDGGAVWSTGTNTDNPIAAPVEEVATQAAAVEDAPPPPPPAAQTYTVEPGDTLWAIAERFYGDGNRYQQIADANGIPNPDAINAGQVLTIP